MTTIAIDARSVRQRHPAVFARSWGSRLPPLAILGGIAAYLVFTWWFFAIGAAFTEGRWDRAGAYMADWVSWQVRPNLRLHEDRVEVAWPRFNPLGPDPDPDWMERIDPATVRTVVGAAEVVTTPRRVTVTYEGERLEVDITSGSPRATTPLPTWARTTEDEIDADFGFSGRVEIKPTRVAVVHRFLGWPNFVFDPSSRFFGMPAAEVASAIVSGPRLDPDRSNMALALSDFWNNAEWQHGDVFAKLLQTVVMAFAGTMLATVLAFPLSFLAARNVTPSRLANQAAKRFFDFLRTVDSLIWALFFIRGFGPGPIPGIGAIAVTDTGSLGKLYAEAIENIDDGQRESIRSTGAPPATVQRFGVLPQVLPVFLSQALYHLESNTRSATIIGAVGAGGIGLKLLEAMRTNQDWENVFYMVLLILAVVMAIDGLSGALRRRLIGASR